MPLTLLGAPADAEVIVAELGARHVGDVALLVPRSPTRASWS